MLRERAELVASAFFVADLSLLCLAAIASYDIRQSIHPPLHDWSEYLPLSGVLIASWSGLLYYYGLYDSLRARKVYADVPGLVKCTAAGFLIAGAIIFGLKLHFVSRLLIGIYATVAFVLVAMGRIACRFFANLIPPATRHVAVLGKGPRAEQIISLLIGDSSWGVSVVNCPESVGVFGTTPHETAAALSRLLRRNVVDEVIFAVEPGEVGHIKDSLLVCERLGVRTHISLDLADLKIAKALPNDLHGIPLLTFTTTPHNERLLIVKRTIDIVVAGLALVFFGPVLLVVAAAVKLTSPGPVLFRQERAGANGRRFIMYKFRSMVDGAEALQPCLSGANQMIGPVFKIRNDPRLTPIGGLLRRASLDELPQLWNVLRGDMSLVGPRPPVPSEVEQYEMRQRRRLSMKPGLTCLWQVSGRSEINDFESWISLDLQYIDRWSLWLDMVIMLKTIPAVLSGRGAE